MDRCIWKYIGLLNLSSFWSFDRGYFSDGKDISIGTRVVIDFIIRLRLSWELCRDIVRIFYEIFACFTEYRGIPRCNFERPLEWTIWVGPSGLKETGNENRSKFGLRRGLSELYQRAKCDKTHLKLIQKHSWNKSRFSKRILSTWTRSLQCVLDISIKLTFSVWWTFQLFIFSP